MREKPFHVKSHCGVCCQGDQGRLLQQPELTCVSIGSAVSLSTAHINTSSLHCVTLLLHIGE